MCSTIIAGAASSSPPSSWENQPAGQGQENLFSTSSEKASRRRLCQNWRYRKEVWRSSVFSSFLICSFGWRKRRAVASCSIAVSGRAGGRGELPLPFSKPGFASWLEWLCWQQAREGGQQAGARCRPSWTSSLLLTIQHWKQLPPLVSWLGQIWCKSSRQASLHCLQLCIICINTCNKLIWKREVCRKYIF